MAGDRSALQTPYGEAWPTPDVGGTGLNGLGNGLDLGGGGNGLIQTPWTDKVVSPPSGTPTGGGEIPAAPSTINVPGGAPAGSQIPIGDLENSRNTIDKR